METLSTYKYRGARAMVLLHETHLREFLSTWRAARDGGLRFQTTSDPDYASLDTLLRHVLRAARGYMVWMCESLRLPDPGIRPAPEADAAAREAGDYVEHVVSRWRAPLDDVPEEAFHAPTYRSRWKVEYCIDAMLEHAVMHPIRHTFQLKELMEKAKNEGS